MQKVFTPLGSYARVFTVSWSLKTTFKKFLFALDVIRVGDQRNAL